MNQQITTESTLYGTLNKCKQCGALTTNPDCCFQCSNDYIKKIIPEEDKVDHPKHYNNGNVEVIEIIKQSLTKEQFKGFLLGNILKYILRHEHKGGKEDIKKWIWYSNYYLNNV